MVLTYSILSAATMLSYAKQSHITSYNQNAEGILGWNKLNKDIKRVCMSIELSSLNIAIGVKVLAVVNVKNLHVAIYNLDAAFHGCKAFPCLPPNFTEYSVNQAFFKINQCSYHAYIFVDYTETVPPIINN